MPTPRSRLIRPSRQPIDAPDTQRTASRPRPARDDPAAGQGGTGFLTISQLFADPERLASEKQAAAIIGVAHRTLGKWRREGSYPELQFFRRGRRIFYPMKSLSEHLRLHMTRASGA